MFTRRSYEAIDIEDDDEGIELIENKAIVRNCWYHGGELSTLVYFHRNCLGIGLSPVF